MPVTPHNHDFNYLTGRCNRCGVTMQECAQTGSLVCRGYREIVGECVFISDPPKDYGTWVHIPVVDAEENRADVRSHITNVNRALAVGGLQYHARPHASWCGGTCFSESSQAKCRRDVEESRRFGVQIVTGPPEPEVHQEAARAIVCPHHDACDGTCVPASPYVIIGSGTISKRFATPEETSALERMGVNPGDVSEDFMQNLRAPRRFATPGRKWLDPDHPTAEKAYAALEAGQMLAALATGDPVPRFGIDAVTAYVHPRSLKGRVNVAALAVDDPNGDDVS